MKEKPCRSCIVCGSKKTKEELVRIVKTADGKVLPDLSGRLNGRGAYLCRNLKCIQGLKKGSLERAFKMSFPAEVYDELFKRFEEQNIDE